MFTKRANRHLTQQIRELSDGDVYLDLFSVQDTSAEKQLGMIRYAEDWITEVSVPMPDRAAEARVAPRIQFKSI